MKENIHYAKFIDGEHWEKPSVELYEWNGSKDNNIICTPKGDGYQWLYHVIRDESDPDPTRRAIKACLIAASGTLAFPMMDSIGQCLMYHRSLAKMNPSSPMIHLQNNILQR